jgi:hypothetical protein
MVLRIEGCIISGFEVKGCISDNAIVEGGKMDLSLYRFNGLDYPH